MTRARDLADFNFDGKAVTVNESSADLDFRVEGNGDANLLFVDAGNDRVGIGTNSPQAQAHIEKASGAGTLRLSKGTVSSADDGIGTIQFRTGNTTAAANIVGRTDTSGSGSGALQFSTGTTSSTNEAMRITASGFVGIGNSSPGTFTLNSSPNLVVGTGSGSEGITVYSGNDASGCLTFADGTSGAQQYAGFINYNHDLEAFQVATGGSEKIRIDSGGNILINQNSTTSPGFSNTTTGQCLADTGQIFSSAASGPSNFNRNSDGEIINLRKDGGLSGQLGIKSSRPFFSNGDNSGIRIAGNALHPSDQNGTAADNSESLGESSARWTQLFAGTTTIGTSDENEKQNITSLTDAEILAAKAISKLFKTFKFKDAVTSKADAARTHTGVIAQEVQAAMSAAGLDATKYAFWCSDTWTNDDGNEQTRLGIRYAELLSFIGAATEQRLADIETRLTALENA